MADKKKQPVSDYVNQNSGRPGVAVAADMANADPGRPAVGILANGTSAGVNQGSLTGGAANTAIRGNPPSLAVPAPSGLPDQDIRFGGRPENSGQQPPVQYGAGFAGISGSGPTAGSAIMHSQLREANPALAGNSRIPGDTKIAHVSKGFDSPYGGAKGSSSGGQNLPSGPKEGQDLTGGGGVPTKQSGYAIIPQIGADGQITSFLLTNMSPGQGAIPGANYDRSTPGARTQQDIPTMGKAGGDRFFGGDGQSAIFNTADTPEGRAALDAQVNPNRMADIRGQRRGLAVTQGGVPTDTGFQNVPEGYTGSALPNRVGSAGNDRMTSFQDRSSVSGPAAGATHSLVGPGMKTVTRGVSEYERGWGPQELASAITKKIMASGAVATATGIAAQHKVGDLPLQTQNLQAEIAQKTAAASGSGSGKNDSIEREKLAIENEKLAQTALDPNDQTRHKARSSQLRGATSSAVPKKQAAAGKPDSAYEAFSKVMAARGKTVTPEMYDQFRKSTGMGA